MGSKEDLAQIRTALGRWYESVGIALPHLGAPANILHSAVGVSAPTLSPFGLTLVRALQKANDHPADD